MSKPQRHGNYDYSTPNMEMHVSVILGLNECYFSVVLASLSTRCVIQDVVSVLIVCQVATFLDW